MNTYCKISVYISGSYQLLKSQLEKNYGFKADDFGTISGIDFDIDFNKNEDFDDEKATLFPDGGLYFSHYLDVFFKPDNIDGNKVISVISDLLLWLWDNDYPAVASCHYEDLLPEKGGYKSQNIPWP